MTSAGDSRKILVCSDLDRTLIPNGFQEESAHARPTFGRLAKSANIYLAYVSGRDKKLILDAIGEYSLPTPDYAIGDVGTTLYRIIKGNWQMSREWNDEIGKDWKGLGWETLSKSFEDMREIRLQETKRQNQHKLSFYTDRIDDCRQLIQKMHFILEGEGVRANVIWSVDEINAMALLDVIPARANKFHAIQFLMKREHFGEDRTVFAGDSGNDLDVLTSGLQAILVKNAKDDVRQEALETLSAKGMTHRLYLPRGDFCGLNGNYAAGVLEGLAHVVPETADLIGTALA